MTFLEALFLGAFLGALGALVARAVEDRRASRKPKTRKVVRVERPKPGTVVFLWPCEEVIVERDSTSRRSDSTG